MTSKGNRLRAHPFLVIESKSGIILKRGVTEIILKGDSALETLLLILTCCSDHGASIQEICDQFALPFREEVEQLVTELANKRLLVPEEYVVTGTGESNTEIFYWQFGTAQARVVSLLSDLQLVIAGVNGLSRQISQSLHAMGVSNFLIADDPLLRSTRYFATSGKLKPDTFNPEIPVLPRSHFFNKKLSTQCVISTSEFGQSALLPWNELSVQSRIQFMPVYVQDMFGYVGPMVIPGETACLHCLRMRQNAHLHDVELEREKEEHLLRGESIAAIHPSMITVIAETVVFELCHFFGALRSPRIGRHIRIDMTRGTTEHKKVLKIPRCPVCSTHLSKSTVQLEKLFPWPE